MNRIGLRRAALEMAGELALSLFGLVVLRGTDLLQIALRQALVLLMPGFTTLFAVRLRFARGHWPYKLAFEWAGLTLTLLINGAVLAFAPLLAPSIPWAFFFGFIAALVVGAYWTTRAAVRFWRFWNRLRQQHLMWALTHAHMVVALTLVWLGFVMVVVTLAMFIPLRTSDPLNQLLFVLPFSILLVSPSVIVLIFFLGVSAAFSYVVMLPTVRRLQALVSATDQLSSGNYAARSPVSGKDEVMRLQVNFNQMAGELERTVRDLRSERDSVSRLLQLRRELMTSVSHELRTPIATLRAYVEAMRDTRGQADPPLPDHLAHDLQVVTDEVIRLQTLVDDLFTLARTETRQLPLHCEPTDMAQLVTHVVEAVAPLAWNSYRVQVAADVHTPVPFAKGDSVRIEQALRNLIQNSLQHTPPGGIVSIEVGTTHDQVWLSVEDTGYGIDTADLPHIWERFYRGKDARTREGSGLGLALVKELVEAMGGGVAVSSVPHQGSRFTVCLPCV